jgi:hypothetical protein
MRNCPTESIIFIDDDEYAQMNAQLADSQPLSHLLVCFRQTINCPENTERAMTRISVNHPSVILTTNSLGHKPIGPLLYSDAEGNVDRFILE